MVSFVQSVDTVNDGLLSGFISVANASVDSLETVASTAITERGRLVASIDSLELVTGGNTTALEASVDSLEAVDTGLADDIQTVQDNLDDYASWTNASVDSLEAVDDALSLEIAGNASDISDNGAAIGDLQSSVDSLELIDAALSGEIAGNATYVKQGAQPVSPTTARFNTAIRIGASDDVAVYINGHEIHPVGIVINQENDFESAPVSTTEGYTIIGTTVTFVNIGYDLEPTDHVHVRGVVA